MLINFQIFSKKFKKPVKICFVFKKKLIHKIKNFKILKIQNFSKNSKKISKLKKITKFNSLKFQSTQKLSILANRRLETILN